MKNRILGLLAAVALLFAPTLAMAQHTGGAPVAQQSQRFDVGSSLCSISTAVNATQAAGTCTITPPAGQYVYITWASLSMCGDGTASQSPIQLAFTTTNLNNLTLQVAAISGSTITTNPWANLCWGYTLPGPTPIKSAQAGVAVVITPPAQTAHVSFPITVIGYFSP